MHWATLKIILATLYIPLILPMVLTNGQEECSIRTVPYPRNRDFLDLCGREPNAPVAAKNAKHPCFKLETSDLHDTRLTPYPGEYDDFPDTNVIIKDGDLTHFTFLDATKITRIFWNEAGIQLSYFPHPRSENKPGCYEVELSVWQILGWRMYVQEEKGDRIVADSEVSSEGTGIVCTKWARVTLEKIPNYNPDFSDQRN
ncbi:uncharacterized protein UTRI_10155 [Ustilago trichophora]|uniref:Mig1 protein, induced during biotrophic phase n=1 Tax=Ustilago trichophora TaxID=86804 RepID=A0A5C3E981_9BASI|nr:uncharacterized protein UTRI_10155 [Ustilago trichophora]